METTLRISSGAISDKGLSEKRPENEDAFLERPECGIYAVADGVGGAQAGDVASQMAMEILHEAFVNLRPGIDPESMMVSAIEKANSSIYQMARDLSQLASMATTVVALHLNGNIATIGHVGDSRLYRVDREGNFYRETDDHSMVAEEVRAGRMTEEQAVNHPSRNIISRALGAESTVTVDIKTFMVDGGTAFLLCSDGITRHITDQEIKGVLTFGGSPTDICEYLKDLCYHRGAEDNLTAVVVKTGSQGSGAELNVGTFNSGETLRAIDLDESTVASPRPEILGADTVDNDEDLLELANKSRNVRSYRREADHSSESPSVISDIDEIPVETDASPLPETKFRIEPPAPRDDIFVSGSTYGSNLSILGSPNPGNGLRKSKLTPRILSSIALVAIGASLGVGAYYFMSPEPVDTDGPRLTEMRAANIPLSAFEENRRNVDKDPAQYVARFGADPQDCEDYYLLARAYLLTGDYTNARNALVQSRQRLGEADPSNAAVIASDIAIAMSVTNGTTVQSMFKKELEAAKPINSSPSANANSN